MEKYQYFDNLKFTRDDKTGYYLNSTHRIRMHRYVWEYYNGKIPKGYCVHHIDHNKSNNKIENLTLVLLGNHSKLHGNERATQYYEEMCENLEKNARPKAIEWHKSDEGLEWHKTQYKNVLNRFKKEMEFICLNCGTSFTSKQVRSKFCSNACKSSYRRKEQKDDETRKCEYCGREYKTNKYSKGKTCSKSCSNKLYPRRVITQIEG